MCLCAMQPHQRYVLHANLSSCQLLLLQVTMFNLVAYQRYLW